MNVPDRHVPHEQQVRDTIDDRLEDTSDHGVIADVIATAISDAASPGATYDQAEVVALRTQLVAVNARLALVVASHNAVLDVLRDAELIPSS